MRRLGLSLFALATSATLLMAQGKETLELRALGGVLIPTGDQRNIFKDSPLAGIELGAELRPDLHILGTFVWVFAQDRFSFSDQAVSIFEFNVGVEMGWSMSLNQSWLFKPFLGLGGGARTYSYVQEDVIDQTCGELYGAAGAEFQTANTAFRLESRDNIFCYRSPFDVTRQDRRNDIAVTLGVAYHFR